MVWDAVLMATGATIGAGGSMALLVGAIHGAAWTAKYMERRTRGMKQWQVALAYYGLCLAVGWVVMFAVFLLVGTR